MKVKLADMELKKMEEIQVILDGHLNEANDSMKVFEE